MIDIVNTDFDVVVVVEEETEEPLTFFRHSIHSNSNFVSRNNVWFRKRANNLLSIDDKLTA